MNCTLQTVGGMSYWVCNGSSCPVGVSQAECMQMVQSNISETEKPAQQQYANLTVFVRYANGQPVNDVPIQISSKKLGEFGTYLIKNGVVSVSSSQSSIPVGSTVYVKTAGDSFPNVGKGVLMVPNTVVTLTVPLSGYVASGTGEVPITGTGTFVTPKPAPVTAAVEAGYIQEFLSTNRIVVIIMIMAIMGVVAWLIFR